MSFSPLHKLIPKALVKLNLSRESRAALICERYRRCAPEIVNPAVLNHSTPLYFKNGTLTVAAESSVWAHEISTKAHVLLDAINLHNTAACKRIKTTLRSRRELISKHGEPISLDT